MTNERKTPLSVSQILLRGCLIIAIFFLFGIWYISVIPLYLSQIKCDAHGKIDDEGNVKVHESDAKSPQQKDLLPK